MPNSTFGDLGLKLSSKLGNQSKKYFSDSDRAAALNWARNTLGYFDFPELIKVATLTFATTTLNTQSCAVATEPTDLQRIVKMWDPTQNLEYTYTQPNLFDLGNPSNVFTREIVSGIRSIYVYPDTTTSLLLRYAKKIVQFGSDASVVNEFDPQYDDVIINGAVTWLESKGRDYNDSLKFEQDFQRDAARMFQNVQKQGGWAENQRLTQWGEKFSILHR